MKLIGGLVPVLVAGFLAATPMPAAAETVEDFTAACTANPDFFDFAIDGLESNPGDLERVCGCLATAFADYPEADLAMLTHDVEGSATPEERSAYGDYPALEMRALGALNACLVAEGLSDDAEPVSPSDPAVPADPAAPADMSGFDASCLASEGLLQVIGGTRDEAIPYRTTLCQCLSVTLGTQVTTADADVLGHDLDGTATEESRNAHPGYTELTEIAGAAFQSCFAALELAE